MTAALRRTRSKSNGSFDSVVANRLFLVLSDLLIGCLAYFSAWLVRIYLPVPFTQERIAQFQWLMVSHPWIVLVFGQLFFPYLMGLYDDLRQVRKRELVALTFIACVMQVFLVTSVLFFLNPQVPEETEWLFPRTVIVLFGGFNFAGLLAWRAYLRSRVRQRTRRILVVGKRFGHASELLENVSRSPGTEVVGLVLEHPETAAENASEYPVLGEVANVGEIVEHFGVDEIVFCSAPSWRDRVLNGLCKLQEETRVNIGILPSPFDITIGKLRHINIHDTPLIEVKENPNEPFERFLKRFFDITIATAGMILSAPFMLLIGVVIRLASPGPALYRQERVGQNGVSFRLFKFRTMVDDAERASGATLAVPNDPRVTPVGRILRRFRLDELPQLWNVIKGDMSFVGPRPEHPHFVSDYEKRVPGFGERHKVKPGMTGRAQVRSFYDTRPESKLKYDLAYIYNYSLSLDLLILLETLKVIVTRRGS